MYVCVCVQMWVNVRHIVYVYLYECIYVCVYVCVEIPMHAWMHGCINISQLTLSSFQLYVVCTYAQVHDKFTHMALLALFQILHQTWRTHWSHQNTNPSAELRTLGRSVGDSTVSAPS